MKPTIEERMDRIREVAHRSLRYYATAYLKTDVEEKHVIAEQDLLMAYMTDLANVIALLEGDELDDKPMMAARREVIARYVVHPRSRRRRTLARLALQFRSVHSNRTAMQTSVLADSHGVPATRQSP